MEMFDILLFIGVLGAIFLSMALGVMLAIDALTMTFLCYFVVGSVTFVVLSLGVGIILQKMQNRKEKEDEEESVEMNEPEIEPMPAVEVENFVEKILAKRCANYSKRFLLCRIAIDGIDQAEKQYGRDVVERLIINVKERMETLLTEKDKVFRIENDEFIVLVEAEETSDWKERIGALDAGMDSTFIIHKGNEEYSIETSVSVGFAIFPSMSQSPAELINIAGIQLNSVRGAKGISTTTSTPALSSEEIASLNSELTTEELENLKSQGRTKEFDEESPLDLSTVLPEEKDT